MNDPLQKNLFDVFDGPVVPTDETDEAFEANEPVVAGGILGVEDDPLLAIVAEHILGTIEVASLQEASPVHFDELIGLLRPMGISVDEIDEALAHLLQHRFIIELEQDLFGLNS
jgi:hypothetical protein